MLGAGEGGQTWLQAHLILIYVLSSWPHVASHQSPLPANGDEGAFPPPRDTDSSLDRPTPTLQLAEGGQILEVLPLPELVDGPHDSPRALVIPVLDPSLFVTLTSFPETCLPLASPRVSPVCSFPPTYTSLCCPLWVQKNLGQEF